LGCNPINILSILGGVIFQTAQNVVELAVIPQETKKLPSIAAG
jgi:hypothetical protein